MISDSHVRWIALFFLFSLLDEKVAVQATQRTITSLKARTPEAVKEDEASFRVRLISTCFQFWSQYKKSVPKGKHLMTFAGWSLPDHADLGPWARFQKEASDEELLSVVLSRLLGFSEDEMAKGLQISEGTARYRVARGVRLLGEMSKARA